MSAFWFRLSIASVLTALTLAGCGGDSEQPKAGGPDAGPAAQSAAPAPRPEVEQSDGTKPTGQARAAPEGKKRRVGDRGGGKGSRPAREPVELLLRARPRRPSASERKLPPSMKRLLGERSSTRSRNESRSPRTLSPELRALLDSAE